MEGGLFMLRLADSNDVVASVEAPVQHHRIGRAGITVEYKGLVRARTCLNDLDETRTYGGRSSCAGNPILEWLKHKPFARTEYLQHLAEMDADLSDAPCQSYSLTHMRRRLALALFIDYSHDQGLSAGEVAVLLADAQRSASEAVEFLIESDF